MKFIVMFDVDNAEFVETDFNQAVSFTLADVAKRVAGGALSKAPSVIRDMNGNVIGVFQLIGTPAKRKTR